MANSKNLTKREFVKWYCAHKKPEIVALYPANDPHRAACLAMSLADLEMEEAPRFWRKYGKYLRTVTLEQWQERIAKAKEAKAVTQ